MPVQGPENQRSQAESMSFDGLIRIQPSLSAAPYDGPSQQRPGRYATTSNKVHMWCVIDMKGHPCMVDKGVHVS